VLVFWFLQARWLFLTSRSTEPVFFSDMFAQLPTFPFDDSSLRCFFSMQNIAEKKRK